MYYKMVQCTIGPILAFGFVLQNGTVYKKGLFGPSVMYLEMGQCTVQYTIGPILAFSFVLQNDSVYIVQ